MYIVLSYDFEGSFDICIHCVSHDGFKAQKMFDNLCERFEDYNKEYQNIGIKKMIDFLKVPDEFEWEEGLILFSNSSVLCDGVERIKSNT